MSSISLSKILRKNKDAKTFLEHLCDTIGQDISIYDNKKRKLIGQYPESEVKLQSIYFEKETKARYHNTSQH